MEFNWIPSGEYLTVSRFAFPFDGRAFLFFCNGSRKHEDWIATCERRGFGTIIRGGVALGESEKKLLK